ncbi:acetyltransferase GNAT Family [Streptococcus porcinus]|uniref:GNAT family N-acetyltransferase n=1 Tax=Streptococcus porcinus TaxID=1340 RepID=UPI0010CAC357|nr:GNAT family protein [Streptococcus porcinus]VTS23434.1 acetyltransferase GNAT Family [Streptococcus porcinus]
MQAQIEEILRCLDPKASAYFQTIIPEYQKGYVDYIYQSEDYEVQGRRLKYISKLFQVWQDKPWYYLMPLSQEAAETIANDWQYPSPYDFYNLTADPDDYDEIINPDLRKDTYVQVIRNGILFGFASFVVHGKELAIGLGMAPKWTGQSYGSDFLKAIEDYALKTYQVKCFVLNVAAFNKRAQRLYSKCGYKEEGHFAQKTNGAVYDFVRMTKSATDSATTKK